MDWGKCEAIDRFIYNLYASTRQIGLARFRHWALMELQNVLAFDAAIWSTGHLSTRTFHTHTTVNLPDDYPDKLLESLPINPISKVLFAKPGLPVDMSDVLPDEAFYTSDIYASVFKPNAIERILSSIHIDPRSGIYTLLTIYRSERNSRYSSSEKQLYQRALFHLLQAANLACIENLSPGPAFNDDRLTYGEREHYALCDQHGVYHAVGEGFLDLIEHSLPHAKQQILPFPVNTCAETVENGLKITTDEIGDLFRISIRPANSLDSLSPREHEVVKYVTKGLSFKQIARKLELSPSTVSNHLYRVYQKLDVHNRADLASLYEPN